MCELSYRSGLWTDLGIQEPSGSENDMDMGSTPE